MVEKMKGATREMVQEEKRGGGGRWEQNMEAMGKKPE